MDDFLRGIEEDAHRILRSSNERRLKSLKGVHDAISLPSSPIKDVPTSSHPHPPPLSPKELASLSDQAIALSSPKRRPLVPTAHPSEPFGVTSDKVLRGLSAASASAKPRKAAASTSTATFSPFLGATIKLDPPKKRKKKVSKAQKKATRTTRTRAGGARQNITRKQLATSLAASPSAGSDTISPTELDVEVLRKKYRCEHTRAEAYEAYVKRSELRALVNGDGRDDCLVVADDEAPVEKHPIQARVEELVARENKRARERSRRKLESNAWEAEVHQECVAELDKIREVERRELGATSGDGTSVNEESPYEEPPEPLGQDDDVGSAADREGEIIRNPSPNLSMRLAGVDLHELSTLLPGCTAIGPVGGLHRGGKDEDEGTATTATTTDRTQAVACFTRDPTTSAPKVTIAQAVEMPMFSKPTIAFDPTQIKPPPARHEEPSGIMPDIYPPNDIIDRNPLISPIADARPSTVVVLDPAATEDDYASARSDTEGATGCSNAGDGEHRIQHRRHLEEVTNHGFPLKCYAAPIDIDTSLVTHDVGITEEGITMPKPAVSGIVECHPGECTTESLSKERTPLDYLYIAQDPHSGQNGGTHNEGALFTILMNKYEINSIVRTTERKQQSEQDRLQDVQAENRKRAEMAAKLKAATELMERRLATQREKILRQEAPGYEEAIEEDEVDANNDEDRIEPQHEGNGEEAWQRRMKCSVIATVQDVGDAKWEERQLMDSKKRFYRNVDPCLILSDATTWDPPPGWDRVALPVPDIGEDGDGISNTRDTGTSDADSDERSNATNDNTNEEVDEIGRLASLLAKNDEFVKAMAARLGVPEDKVRSLGEDEGRDSSSVDSDDGSLQQSNDHRPCTSHHELPPLLQGYADVYAIKCAERLRKQQGEGTGDVDPLDRGGGVRGYEWRRLPRAIVGGDFFHLNKRKVQAFTDSSSFCQPNRPKLVGLVDPVKGIERVVDDNFFQTKLNTLFISDIKADRFRMVEDQKKQTEQEESLLDASQQEALDQILNLSLGDGVDAGTSDGTEAEAVISPGGSGAKTSASARPRPPEIIDLQGKSNAELTMVATDAVKNANYNIMEHVLDEIGLSVNCRDEHGNTLLILASQRANKRTVKFLLRRNANMNAQNLVGCTALHYLYEYGHDRLAEYLVSKGASDEVINKAGLSVYEGLSRETVDAL